jgi:hypothetical protein
MCLSLYDMTICNPVCWSEIHMSCQYSTGHSIGHISSKLFKVKSVGSCHLGGKMYVCVIDTESK